MMFSHGYLHAAVDKGTSQGEGAVTPPVRQPTPLRLAHRSLRPYVRALLAFRNGHEFQSKPSVHLKRRLSEPVKEAGGFAAVALKPQWLGISAVFDDTPTAMVALAVHDETYLVDFCVHAVDLSNKDAGYDAIANYVIQKMEDYQQSTMCKFIGAGLPCDLMKQSPTLCSRLWLELDVVPLSIAPHLEGHEMDTKDDTHWNLRCVDEQADSMARKCVMHFGPKLAPLLQVGFRGLVEVDAGLQARLLTAADFEKSCSPSTWGATMKYIASLKERKTRIAFFSSTPQGGGVAIMRHALVRFAKVMGVDLAWYVPKPKPGVFRITKTMHNILQGVSNPHEFINKEEKKMLVDWIEENANRYWSSSGGPLRPPEEGGADVIIIDDPQMPGLIPMIKQTTPKRPVLYRSHIQIRSDLIMKEGTPQADIWQFLWSKIQHADMFISHPIPSFVPHNVPRAKVAYMPAATDWLDGLNKDLSDWNLQYYGHLYNEQCHALRMTELKWPVKKYIIQVARFDPAKGIPDVLDSYAEFRRLLSHHSPHIEAPQLLICGNGSIDDPDGTIIYDQTMLHIETRFPHLLPSISVIKLQPNDQLLNTLMSASHIVLQLSTSEGFEVKVSEGLHKGKPVIATKAGGIPLQMQHGKNGFLVEPGDVKAVAKHLLELCTDDALYERIATYAKGSVSDEIGTVGNALSWFYLANQWGNGREVVPAERWVNDLAREEAGFPYGENENRIARF